jgi:predicted amidohydrolase YtcJ
MNDLILFNANVITVDANLPRAELVSIKGRRIAHVGDNGILDELRTPATRIIDCGGRSLLPGFIDAHCHVHAYAESLISPKLSPKEDVHSIADIQRRIRDFSLSRAEGAWIRGKAYNEFYLAESRHPTREDLDVAAPRHPVKLTHRSGHAHVLNSLALERVGITTETGDPPEGLIDRDPETGMPTGILYGMGEYLAARIPSVDDAELDRGLALANERMLSSGITSVQDASSINNRHRWARFASWKKQDVFQPRINMVMGLSGFEGLELGSFSSAIDCTRLRSGAVKIIVGQITGTLQPSQDALNEQISAINEAGLQAVIHAVEEPEIEAACNAIAFALDRHRRTDHRHRIEHCSVCPPHLQQKIAELGITVVTQPSFIFFSGDRYLKTVSSNQFNYLYPIGSLFRNKIRVGFSSDFPISDPNPLTGIYAAVTRMTEGNSKVLPQEGVPVLDALRMYTLDAAAAAFEETIKGSISPGKLADLVMLSENPCEVDAGSIKDIRVLMTMLDGRIVWSDDTLSL